MAKSIDQLQEEFGVASEKARVAYDLLNGTGGRGGLEQTYQIALRDKEKNEKDPGSVRNFNLKEFNTVKAQYDKAVRDYKVAQEAKNAANLVLKRAKKEKTKEKSTDANKKVAESAYSKASQALREAESKLTGYKGEENYVAAYKAAKIAADALTKAGGTVALPAPRITIPEDVQKAEETTAVTQEEQVAQYSQIVNTLADPVNKKLLIDTQNNLKKNFGYTGPTDGTWSLAFQSSLQRAYETRVGLPKVLQGKDFASFIVSPGIDTGIKTGATGTGGPSVTEYPTISSPTDAASAINRVFNAELGRDATNAELSALTPKLLDAQRKSPSRQTVRTVGGKKVVETVTGLDTNQFLVDQIKRTPALKTEIDMRLKSAQSLTRQALENTARANGLDLNKNFGSVVDTWVNRIDNGENIDVFNNLIRSTAKIGLPDKVAGLLDNGIDLETVYSPYKRLMASTLEIAPDSISIDDSTLRTAIGPEKEMSLYDFQRSLRKDPRWQYTDQARESVSEAALGVLRDFGFMG
jgi:hypothetical protein